MNFFPSHFLFIWCTMNLQRILLSFGRSVGLSCQRLNSFTQFVFCNLTLNTQCWMWNNVFLLTYLLSYLNHLANLCNFLFSRLPDFNYWLRQKLKLIPENCVAKVAPCDTQLNIPFNTISSFFWSPPYCGLIMSERWNVWV